LVYSSSRSETLPFINQSAEVLSLPPVSNSDVHNANKLNPRFVMKGCSETFVPVLKFIFNLCLAQNTFPNISMESAVVPVFKTGNASFVGNYRLIDILNSFFLNSLIYHK
jgi:hypothetical protein